MCDEGGVEDKWAHGSQEKDDECYKAMGFRYCRIFRGGTRGLCTGVDLIIH